MNRQELKLSFVADKGHFSRFYETVLQVSEQLGLNADVQFRFAVCLSEAYTNAYLHGNKEDPEKKVNLHFRWDEHQVQVEIEDEGDGKTSSLDLNASLGDVLPEKSGGRGVGIMKEYADKIEIEERAEGGLRLRLTFRLQQRAAQSGVPPQNSNGG